MSETRRPYVYVTLEGPDDGGDFGPRTPGTSTGGIQEALDYAHANYRDIYIHGGRGGLNAQTLLVENVYELSETLRIPFSQDFRLDGGNAVLRYTAKAGDAVVIDSQMSCRYKFGLIVSEADGAAVRIYPHTRGPDDFTVVETSVFDFAAVCSYHERGAGVVLDSSEGPILHTKVLSEEINSWNLGLYLTGRPSDKAIAQNEFRVNFNQQCHAQGVCTNLRVGDPGCTGVADNRFLMWLYAPLGVYWHEEDHRWVVPRGFVPPEDALGAQIYGQNNYFSLSFYGRRGAGNDLVFEADARDNTVRVFSFPNGHTSRARLPSNRIIPNQAVGFGLSTPPVPASGMWLANASGYLADVIILTSGAVVEWSLGDSCGNEQTIEGGLVAGQSFRLEPGDKVRFVYNQPPAWRWKALR